MNNAEPWPTEDAATKAVDAAARDAYERYRRTLAPREAPEFDELEANVRLHFREVVLPTVWAALTALPDPRYAAFEQGAASVEYAGGGVTYGDNPYSSGL